MMTLRCTRSRGNPTLFEQRRGPGNRPPGSDQPPQDAEIESGAIRRRCWLGGMVKTGKIKRDEIKGKGSSYSVA